MYCRLALLAAVGAAMWSAPAHADTPGAVLGPEVSFRASVYAYTAFGTHYVPKVLETVAQRYAFAGREAAGPAAATAGAPMFYRNRVYSPALGRFGRRDPAVGGDVLFNEYGFPGSDAVNFGDPTGEFYPPVPVVIQPPFPVTPRRRPVDESSGTPKTAEPQHRDAEGLLDVPLGVYGYRPPLSIDYPKVDTRSYGGIVTEERSYPVRGGGRKPYTTEVQKRGTVSWDVLQAKEGFKAYSVTLTKRELLMGWELAGPCCCKFTVRSLSSTGQIYVPAGGKISPGWGTSWYITDEHSANLETLERYHHRHNNLIAESIRGTIAVKQKCTFTTPQTHLSCGTHAVKLEEIVKARWKKLAFDVGVEVFEGALREKHSKELATAGNQPPNWGNSSFFAEAHDAAVSQIKRRVPNEVIWTCSDVAGVPAP